MSESGHDVGAWESRQRRFDAERRWAEELLSASNDDRQRLYAEINDHYYRSVANDAGHEVDDASIELQARLLEPYLLPTMSLVEFGVGTGGLAQRLAPEVGRYIAVEASLEVTRGLELPANAELVLSSSLVLDLPSGSLDLAYSCHVVEHLHPDDAVVLAREMHRLLRSGGRLVWVTPNRLLGPHDESRHFVDCSAGLHLKEYSHSELAEVLERAGFDDIRVLAGIGQHAIERELGLYRRFEGWLEYLPPRLRRWLLGLGRQPPFRRLEQVVLTATRASAGRCRLEPFLHVDSNRLYNPMTDRLISRDDPVFRAVRQLHQQPHAPIERSLRQRLENEGWLIDADLEYDARHHLQYVSLETTSVCNQRCNFCPVSIAPRPPELMAQELFTRIADELVEFAATLKAVFLHNYNEPTADPQLVERVRLLKERGLPVAFNSNASVLTEELVEGLVSLGGLAFLSINLSTLDSGKYKAERGVNHLRRVLRNLDTVGQKPLAERMEVAVLGHGDDEHREQVEAIRRRLASTRFEVKSFLINDRAGNLELGLGPSHPHRELRGCEQMGSRPLQHLHVTVAGTCVLCCQDYYERHVIGDLQRQSVSEVLQGAEIRRLRRIIYGLEEGPQDLLCRSCSYARV